MTSVSSRYVTDPERLAGARIPADASEFREGVAWDECKIA